jgi:hypothetical protein
MGGKMIPEDIEDKILDEIISKLDALEPGERLSYLERNIEKKVQEYRDSLNEKAIDKINQTISDKNPIPCQCGKTMYYKKSKKNYFS